MNSEADKWSNIAKKLLQNLCPPVAGSCEHGNEPSGSTKFWLVLELAERVLAAQEGLKAVSH
jgi:hypothetical protein